MNIVSLNINGISARTRVGILHDYVRHHELDIIFLQEVTDPDAFNIIGYVTHLNIGADMRGTAIMARNNLHPTDVTSLPTGRAIAANYGAETH
jgi:exonuclease III